MMVSDTAMENGTVCVCVCVCVCVLDTKGSVCLLHMHDCISEVVSKHCAWDYEAGNFKRESVCVCVRESVCVCVRERVCV